MKKLLVLALMMLIGITGLLGCEEEKKVSFLDDPNTVDYTDEAATEMFQTMYGMSNLKSQNLYILDDTLYIDFYYNKEASDSEIDTGRSFAITNLIATGDSPYGDIPYRNLTDPMVKEIEWKTTICNIYRNDKLMWQEAYEGIKLITSQDYRK